MSGCSGRVRPLRCALRIRSRRSQIGQATGPPLSRPSRRPPRPHDFVSARSFSSPGSGIPAKTTMTIRVELHLPMSFRIRGYTYGVPLKGKVERALGCGETGGDGSRALLSLQRGDGTTGSLFCPRRKRLRLVRTAARRRCPGRRPHGPGHGHTGAAPREPWRGRARFRRAPFAGRSTCSCPSESCPSR